MAYEASAQVIQRMVGLSAGLFNADLERILQEAAIMTAQQKLLLKENILVGALEKTRMGQAKRCRILKRYCG